MSLNDKYIINGSTLSAIGDALREKNIPPKQIQGEINVYYKNYTSPWCRDTGYQNFTASDFGLTSQTPVKAKMEITAKNGPSMYIQDSSGKVNWATASVGQIFYVTLPVAMRGDSSYSSSQIIAKIYPLDNNGNYIIPTSEDDTSEYLTEVTTGMVPNPNRQILVQDIASKIQTINQIALITPFKIAGYRNYTTYSTYMGDYISSIEDVEKLIVIQRVSSSPEITIGELIPKNNDTATGSLLNFGSITQYRMRYKTFSGTKSLTSEWEADIASSSGYNYIYFDQSRKQFINASDSTNAITNYGFPAILIYK